KGHKRAMSYLEYGLNQGEGFIVITGEIGAGKTTLVRNLFKKLETENVVAAQLVSTQLDADDLLRMVAAAFGLSPEEASKAVLLKKLESYLLSCLRQGKRALLVVDEAQNLTPRAVEELRMLSNFQTAEKSLLQSFLLGQPEFRKTMQSEELMQLRQRVIASYHLGPLDAGETRNYIQHRLRLAGWKDDPEFDEDAFPLIHEFSGGVPRRINILCDRLLLYGYLEEQHDVDKDTVEEVINDFNNEQGFPATEYARTTPKSNGGETREPQINGAVEKLEQRVNKMEKSVKSVLTLSRKILSLTSDMLQRKAE
ncbi:MAG: XrtA/PEP-CTERM system-associated ATPase, partial [Burkholderiales bacterium]